MVAAAAHTRRMRRLALRLALAALLALPLSSCEIGHQVGNGYQNVSNGLSR